MVRFSLGVEGSLARSLGAAILACHVTTAVP
jgi:hypothetical protein